MLRGYPVNIRDEGHRQELLRDCRYFNFKGLEQRLIPHDKGFNQARGREEIVLRLRDILKSGISVVNEPVVGDPLAGWVNYARPYVDDKPMELVLEIGEEGTRLHFGGPGGKEVRAEFFKDIKARVAKLFEVVATKLNLPSSTQPLGLLMAKGGRSSEPPTPGNTPLSEDLVRVILDPEADITLDGQPWMPTQESEEDEMGSDLTSYPSQSAMPAAGAGAGSTFNTPGATGTTGIPALPSISGSLLSASGSTPSSAGGPLAAAESPTISNFGGTPYHPFTPNQAQAQQTPQSQPQQQQQQQTENPRKRRRLDSHPSPYGVAITPASHLGGEEWIIKTGQWRLRIQSVKNQNQNPNPAKASVECCLVAVKVDAVSAERRRNERRGFLGG